MSDSNNPFSKPAPQPEKTRSDDTRFAWTVAALLGIAAAALGFLWANELAHREDAQLLLGKLNKTGGDLNAAREQLQHDADQINDLQAKLNGLQQEKDTAVQSAKSLENEMRTELESKDVTISKLQGKLTVSILDRVLFDSGESILKPGGNSVLRQIAGILANHPEIKIQVVGHTDNVPIHTARIPSNWELSVARALAAVHFLTEQAGVDPRRISAAGCGEFRPIADNATAEGRAKNRRIAITILPDEIAAADTVAHPPSAPGSANRVTPAPVSGPGPIPIGPAPVGDGSPTPPVPDTPLAPPSTGNP